MIQPRARPLTRLWPDLRSCFRRALCLCEARRRAVFRFRFGFFEGLGIAAVYVGWA